MYDYHILDYPINCGLGDTITAGISLNSNGTVVGYYKCPLADYYNAFRWSQQTGFVTLQLPPGVVSAIPEDINDAGVIVGTYIGPYGERGFVYQNGQYTELPPLQGPYSWASALNNSGTVVGARDIRETTAPYNAFVWSAAEGFTDLGIMIGPDSFAEDINAQGWVTGWTGTGTTISDTFLWHDGQFNFLGPIPGGFTSEPFAISDNGIIVGSGRIPMKGAPVGASRAFLWKNGTFTMLGTLPGQTRSRAFGVHPRGWQVVGDSRPVDHGFIWQNGVMTNLNDIVQPPPGFTIRAAGAVNRDGLIIANASTPGTGVVGILLTPAGQPPGDIDIDCRVGVTDLLIVLADWNQADSPADLDGDGVVGLGDLLIVLENWQ